MFSRSARPRSAFTRREIPENQCVMTIMKYKKHAALVIEGVHSEYTRDAWIHFYHFLPKDRSVPLKKLKTYEKVDGKVSFSKYDPLRPEENDIRLQDGTDSLEALKTLTFHARTIEISEEVAQNLHEQIMDDRRYPPKYIKAGIKGEYSFWDRLFQRHVDPEAHNCISWAREKVRSTGVLEKKEMDVVINEDNIFTHPNLHAVATYAAVCCPFMGFSDTVSSVIDRVLRKL